MIRQQNKEVLRYLPKGAVLENISQNNNSKNGIFNLSGKRYFFKIANIIDINMEFDGYLAIKFKYPVPNLIQVQYIDDFGIIIYEYEASIDSNNGTLCDLINDISIGKNILDKKLNTILEIYKVNMKAQIVSSSMPLDRFYKGRIDSRIIPWYGNHEILQFEIVINNEKQKNTCGIVLELCDFFGRNDKKNCFLSQGDPNDLNIGLKPIFFDFNTAGYNSFESEFAILFWDIFLAGGYFYPKYHSSQYKAHNNAIKNIPYNTPYINYDIDYSKKVIYIDFLYKPIEIRKFILEKFIELYCENLNFKIFKFYLAFRIVSVINIMKMREKDLIISIAMLHKFFSVDKNYLNFLIEVCNNGIR